ncbi:unknown [Eubacterium sp. CAG:786]|nr:unknown [Eubacterium sp. CAG:786]
MQQAVCTDVLAAADFLDTATDDIAVLTDERHDVAHRAYRRKFRVLFHDEFLVLLQRAEKLQHNARAAELLERGIIVGTVRVNARLAHGEFLRGLVVVGYYQPSAAFADIFRFFHRRNAVVYGDDELRALVEYLFQRRDIHAVALAAVGYVVFHIGAHGFKIAVEHRGGGNSVAVVVAVDGDLLSLVEGETDRFNCRFHVFHQHGV